MATNMRYPILLVHGMGYRDDKKFGYWGRIPKLLKSEGFDVHLGYHDANADIETNAAHLARRIDEVLSETGAEKLNIIAHSKGGLDSRYAISTLGAGTKVASLTTMSSPHNGSKTMDILMKFPRPLIRIVAFFTDCWFYVQGDKKPDTYKVFHCFKTDTIAEFNANNPNLDGIMYQSYAFVMRNCFSDPVFGIPNFVVNLIEGENDGLLTPDAVKWGDFRGIYRGTGRRGISHVDEIDFWRRKVKIGTDDGYTDIMKLYLDVAKELAERGY